jgi:hypothetical protein
MMLADSQAEALSRAMLDAGRSAQFVLSTVSAYFGEVAREAVLEAIEEQSSSVPAALDER